jgi:hypothetical protein
VNIDVPTSHSPVINQLPQVNRDHAIKRTRIQFTGLGDMFVF